MLRPAAGFNSKAMLRLRVWRGVLSNRVRVGVLVRCRVRIRVHVMSRLQIGFWVGLGVEWRLGVELLGLGLASIAKLSVVAAQLSGFTGSGTVTM